MVLQYADTSFIANQYVEAIANNKDLEISYIDSLAEAKELLTNQDDYGNLYIIHIDTFDEIQDDYSIFENVIVICNKVSAKVSKHVASYVIKLDKVENWQIFDFIQAECPALSDDNINYLIYSTQGNVYRINNVLEQIKLFDPQEHNKILQELFTAQGTDLYYNTAFTLVDALANISEKTNVVKDILKHRNCCDITPMFVLTLLNTQFRNKAIICCNNKINNTVFKGKDGKTMSPEYFRRIKNSWTYNPKNPASVSKFEALKKNLSFISSIDSKIKLGLLELSEDYLLDYIITHIC